MGFLSKILQKRGIGSTAAAPTPAPPTAAPASPGTGPTAPPPWSMWSRNWSSARQRTRRS